MHMVTLRTCLSNVSTIVLSTVTELVEMTYELNCTKSSKMKFYLIKTVLVWQSYE